MLRRPIHRLTAAFFVVLSLLFSQLAMASYVCPQQSDMQTMAMTMTAGMPCDGMDQKQPTLCHQHAADPGKTFEAVSCRQSPCRWSSRCSSCRLCWTQPQH